MRISEAQTRNSTKKGSQTMPQIAVTFIALTVLYLLRDHHPFFDLPGDFEYHGERVHVIVPMTTCLAVSVLVSFVFAFIGKH